MTGEPGVARDVARQQGQLAGSGRKGRSGERRRPPAWGRDAAVVMGAVWSRPRLWGSALGALRRMARRGWWRRPPFLPVPGEQYWAFRLETAYGGGAEANGGSDREDDRSGHVVIPTAEDVVAYLRWCQRSRPGRG